MSKAVTPQGEHFFDEILKEFQDGDNKPLMLKQRAAKAVDILRSLNPPTTRHEEWKYTNLRSLYKEHFVPFFEINEKNISKSNIHSSLIDEAEHTRIVFINGHYDGQLSSVDKLPEGVILDSLSNALKNHQEIIEREFGEHIHLQDDPFIPLNTIFCRDGIFLYVPKDTVIQNPIHIAYISTEVGQTFFSVPRNLILADQFSKITLIEDYIGLTDSVYLSVPVTEINLQESASMLHIKLQRESKNAFHFSRIGTSLQRGSTYESYSIQIGSQLSRNDILATLNGEQIDCTLDGLVLVTDHQISDTHTKIDHLKPHCTSHQLHKCIIDGYGHSVFNGKIYVHPKAQKTDSFQENRNILLSENGTVDTKPQLEIYADDVKCSHGATIGQLDQDEVFYLKSRGLEDEKARELLSYGFALQIIEQIPVTSVRSQLSSAVAAFTKRNDEILDPV